MFGEVFICSGYLWAGVYKIIGIEAKRVLLFGAQICLFKKQAVAAVLSQGRRRRQGQGSRSSKAAKQAGEPKLSFGVSVDDTLMAYSALAAHLFLVSQNIKPFQEVSGLNSLPR